MKKLIKCPQCRADNEEDSNFCESCGAKLKSNFEFCPECGKKNLEDTNLCLNCGVSLEKLNDGLKTQNNVESNNSDKIILDLTPAESLIILDQGTSIKELLKVTFIDLIFKNVFKLEVREVEKKGILGTKIVKKKYLEKGKNFNMPLKPHEDVFIKYLPSKANSKRFKRLQQRVYKAFRQTYASKKLLEPLALEGYFTVEKKFLGNKYSLSDKGIETQQIMLKLKDEGKDLENWIESDPERARAYILMGGSNVFLTDEHNFNWFKDNSEKIKKLFSGVTVGSAAIIVGAVIWYGAFRKHSHGMDFDDFNGYYDANLSDVFSDSSTFDAFNTIDFNDFDSGFDSGVSDGGDIGIGSDGSF
ncbi:MAG TPA: zinc-ribbon domain-containing protein [Methanobacterium sp.]|nr:zinc-ribbon domain-containing protein [Methanobacterium sp.]